jgi:hypothetical protein
MLRALLLTLLLLGTADAQIALPGSGGSLLPGGLSGLGLPTVPQRMPSLADTMHRTLHRLRQARKLHILALLRDYPRRLEADPHGNAIVRGEVVALSPTAAALARATAAGFSVIRARSFGALGIRLVILRVPAGTSTWRALHRLRQLDPAGSYDFNSIYTQSGTVKAHRGTPGPAYGMKPPAASSEVPAAANAFVGLIDGGVDVGQPVFRGAVIHQHGCAGAHVASAHGTAVASLMIGRDARFAGAAPGAVLYAADVYCGKPTGGSLDAIAAAFAWMARERVPVINVSLVGPPNALLRQVVARVLAGHALIVAAVGNDGPAAPPLYPAAYPGVIGVTGVDAHRRVLFEAERGPQVMFAAPGADIEAARIPRGLTAVRGTSFAAPLVSGLLALRLQRPDARMARLAISDLIAQAVHLGASGRNPTYGYGLVASGLPARSRSAAAASD